jgi:hypothetical protein
MRTLAALLLILASAAAIPAAADALQRRPPPSPARDVLREVERAQTEYRASHGRYTASLRALEVARPAGVDVRITAEGAGGYSAVAVADDEECAVYHGRAHPPRAWVRASGRITCRPR